MYQEFYNFSAEPFRLSPDHDFAYTHKGYTKAQAYMKYAFMRAEGFVMITGRPGTGKTTLVGDLLNELADTSVSIANLVCTQVKANDLLKLVAYEFGISTSVVEKGELLQALTQQLRSWHREGRRALLIVDEAQDLSISAMEELRLLTNIQVDSRPLLQIFLLGQPELRKLILSPRLEQVHQRIIAASHLRPLEQDETEAYIRHRLNVVHWRGNPAISKSVYPLIYKFSEGIPRRINLIFSRLLLHCAVEERQQISVADVRDVVQELQEENLASGESFSESDFRVADTFEEEFSRQDDQEADSSTQASGNDEKSEAEEKPKTEERPETEESSETEEKPEIEEKTEEASVEAAEEAAEEAVVDTTLQSSAAQDKAAHITNRPTDSQPQSSNITPKNPSIAAQRESLESRRNQTAHSTAVSGSSDATFIAKREVEANSEASQATEDAPTRPTRASWPKVMIIFVAVTLLCFGSWN